MDWININDRLPEITRRGIASVSVLVVRDCGEGTLPSHDVTFMWSESQIMHKCHNNPRDIAERWNEQESKGYRVTHWMPLPELPKRIE